MIKYFFVTKNTIAEFFAYRLNFFLWRLRVIVSVLITYFLWNAVFTGTDRLFNYESTEMFTYIILLTFVTSLTLSTQTHRVAEEINNGSLSNFLVKPISYIRYNFFRDIGDKAINTVCSFFEIALLLVFLKPLFFWQSDPLIIFLFFISLFFSVLLYFFISLILSFIGFWSREVWAPRFIFFIIVAFLAGTYFPLDILPLPLFRFLEFLPFTYLIFFPLKIYLGSIDPVVITKGFIISAIWVVILYYLSRKIWRKGLKVYTA